MFKIRAVYESMIKLNIQEGSKLAGVSIDFFARNCSFLATALPEISSRVM